MHSLPLLLPGTRVPAWIPVTLAAAVAQVWRTALQSRLRGELSSAAASYVRYFYALPVDVILLGATWAVLGGRLPLLPARFLLLCFVGGLGQIVGTILLLTVFHLRNFVVGTAYAKTEAAQLVFISVVVFGARLAPLAIVGILIALVGVLALSFAGQRLRWDTFVRLSLQPAAVYGLGTGFAFAVTALALRAASETLPVTSPIIIRSLLVLLVTNTLQTLTQGAYMVWREPGQLRRCLLAWRRAAPVGVLSALGSWGWFTGFTLTNPALVRGLGQIEMVFAFVFGHHFLKERIRRSEVLAVLVVLLGVALIAVADLQ